MNIWLPIVTNLILLGCFILDFVINKKLGWKFTLPKLIVVAGVAVGGYFLTPTIVNALPILAFIGLSNLMLGLFVASTFAIVVDIILTIIFSICYAVNKRKHKAEFNVAKTKRVRAVDKKFERQLRRDERRARRLALTKKQKAGRFFSVLFALVISLVLNVMVSIEIKTACTFVKTAYEIEQVETGYEYTAYGQLDKLISGNNNPADEVVGE